MGYNRLRWVTAGYNRLQWVIAWVTVGTVGYGGLQQVTLS